MADWAGGGAEEGLSTAALRRALNPKSVAIVGVSDESALNNSKLTRLLEPTLASGVEVHFVHPTAESVLGHPVAPSLTSIGTSIDVVASYMSAQRSTELVEEASRLDVGGVVLMAGNFAEAGTEGAILQDRIRKAARAADMAVVGPNGLGFVNVPAGISLSIASLYRRRPGGISLVSHSGAVLSGVTMAAWAYSGVGLNIAVSAGNEAVTDLADYVHFLADDPATTSIGLVIETIRRPDAFFDGVARAIRAGKPVVALKLARNDRSRLMALSHTAAVAGDAWTYDVALRQAGIVLADDPDELVDRLAMFELVPRERWSPVQRLGIVTRTGGFASLGYDVAVAEGLEVPPLESFAEWASVDSDTQIVPNPLDSMTLANATWPEVVDKYTATEELDAIVVIHPIADEDEANSTGTVTEFARAAALVDKPCVLANCSGMPGAWVKPLVGEAVSLGRGLRPTLRGLETMGRFMTFGERPMAAPAIEPVIVPPSALTLSVPEGAMYPFGATMDLLADHGIPVAPHHLIAADDDPYQVALPFAGPYVVKLADVAHRTEHDAVRLHVTREQLPARVEELRAIAAAHGLPATVALQPQVEIQGETFVGVQGQSELGSFVVFGLGGIFVEALGKVGGRRAPMTDHEAHEIIEEFRGFGVMHGDRGRPPWDLDQLADILVKVGRLADGGRDWIGSLDVNPMIYGPNGFVAVDAVLFQKESSRRTTTERAETDGS